jgi:outer membrane protein OmpA-like peptidoglycan-associated protein
LYVTNRPNSERNNFIEFVKGSNGQKIVDANRFVSLTPQILDDSPGRDWLGAANEFYATDRPERKTLMALANGALRVSVTLRFDFGASGFDPLARADIDRLVAFLGSRPSLRGKQIQNVVLVGFADPAARQDEVGQQASPQALLNVSSSRARSVADALGRALTTAGISIPVTHIGLGAREQVACNELANGRADLDGRRINRRVEVWLY